MAHSIYLKRECSACNGQGGHYVHPDHDTTWDYCRECNGEGQLEEELICEIETTKELAEFLFKNKQYLTS